MHGWADGVPELRPPQAIDQPLASGVILDDSPAMLHFTRGRKGQFLRLL